MVDFLRSENLNFEHLNFKDHYDFTEEDISGSDGKKKLSERLMVVLNAKLEKLKEFPGIEDVYFTAFILQ
mgnify:CR=1 FL=1